MADQIIDDFGLTLTNGAEKESGMMFDESQSNLHFDIDHTLNDKAKKNKLSKTNVKNLIKNVLINEDVIVMLRQTLSSDKDANCLYEPKLTRAKIKELLKAYPPSAQQWSLNQQQSIISECRLLIEKEFAEDSEDEEYKPDKILDDEDVDDVKSKFIEINKAIETNNDYDVDKTTVELNDKETIGMRTRSKLSLNDTPLEIIEQAFIPPDITEDMYDSACENDEWMQFLTEFTKPLESVQNYDMEDDPEYNILGDIDFSNVDNEEFRKDKSVKITRKEYNDLMNELNDFTDSYIAFDTDTIITDNVNDNINDKNTVKCKNYKPMLSDYTNSLNVDWKLNNTSYPMNDLQIIDTGSTNNLQQNITETLDEMCLFPSTMPVLNDYSNFQQNVENSAKENMELLKPLPHNDSVCIQTHGLSSKQIILLKEQLTQHIQLITQSYLLCSMSIKFKHYCKRLKKIIEKIKDISTDKIYVPININSSLKCIHDWNEQNIYEIQYTTNKTAVELPKEVKEFIYFYDKPVFIYPKLLPTRMYDLGLKIYPIGPSEEKFLVLKLHYEFRKIKENLNTRATYRNKSLSDVMPILLKTVQRRWFSHRRISDLKKLITIRKNMLQMNIIKNYLIHNKIDDIIHKVSIESLHETKCLYEFDVSKFPFRWKSFLKNLNKKNNN